MKTTELTGIEMLKILPIAYLDEQGWFDFAGDEYEGNDFTNKLWNEILNNEKCLRTVLDDGGYLNYVGEDNGQYIAYYDDDHAEFNHSL